MTSIRQCTEQGKIVSLKYILFFSFLMALFIFVFWVNKHTVKKFDYEFFSKSNLHIAILAFVFFLAGTFVMPKAATLIINWMSISALLLYGISIGLIGLIVFLNFTNTNRWYGLMGSTIQVPILILFSGPALFLSVVGILFKASARSSGKSNDEAFFANQTKARQEREWATNPNNMQNYNGIHQTNQRIYSSKK